MLKSKKKLKNVKLEKICHVKTLPTSHSARRAVVMHQLTYLPPEYIGKYITGQTRRTVEYYAAVNPDSLNRASK